MIAEIPNPASVITSSPFHDRIHEVRHCFVQYCRGAKAKKKLHIQVRVTGPGFFDIPHSGKGQTGHAPNNIELHPVLGLNFLAHDVQCGHDAQ
jgi:hypothetical protein